MENYQERSQNIQLDRRVLTFVAPNTGLNWALWRTIGARNLVPGKETAAAKRIINPEDLDHLFTDNNSGGGNCPALYRVRGGGYVVQGKRLRRRSLRGLRSRSRDESGVWIPDNLIEQIRSGELG